MVAVMAQAEIRAAIANGQVRLPGMKSSKGGIQSGGRYEPEEQLHRDCHAWNEAHIHIHPCLDWIFHSPNGGKRSASEGGRFKAMGVKAGVPDFMLPYPLPFIRAWL